MTGHISVSVFRADGYPDTSNNGVSRRSPRLFLALVEGYQWPENIPKEQRLEVERRDFGMRAFPVVGGCGMNGGTFVYTTDSRFREQFPVPLPLFDRHEKKCPRLQCYGEGEQTAGGRFVCKRCGSDYWYGGDNA